MAWSSMQRYASEFVGTYLLLLAVTAAALVAFSGPTSTNSAVLLISLAIGLALAGGIYVFGDVSGGHFNPAVTVSMAVSRRLAWRDVVPYVLAQVLGGFFGALTVAGVAWGSPGGWSTLVGISFASQSYLWSGHPTSDYSAAAVFLFEVVVTFLFVLVIQRVTRPENGAKNLAPLVIAFTLLMANLIGIGIDGASFNPARSFAPAILAQIWPASGGAFALAEVWIFWLGPLVGGVLAAVVERWLLSPRDTAPAPPPPPMSS